MKLTQKDIRQALMVALISLATFDVVKPIHRNVCFYIQCKCHKEPLTKTAIRHTNVNRDKSINKHMKPEGVCQIKLI